MTPWYMIKQITSAVANFLALVIVIRLIKCSADVMKGFNIGYIDTVK